MRTRHIITIKLLAMLICVADLSAQQDQQVQAFSLDQAIQYALKNSPSAINAGNDIIAAKYRKREIAGVGYPQLNASFDIKNFFKIPVSVIPNFVAPAVYTGILSATTPGFNPDGDPKASADAYPPIAAQFGTKIQAGASISLSQIIFSSDYVVALQAAKYLEQMGTINANRTKADVIAGVSKAYYGVLVNSARMAVLQSNLDRLQKVLRDTKAFNEQGFVETIDVERLEVTYNNLATEKENVERLMTLSDAALRFQMGYTLPNSFTLTDSLPAEVNEQEISLSKADAASRPEYQLARASHELNYLNLKRQRLGYLPSLVAYGSGGYNAFRPQFDLLKKEVDWFPTLLVGATLNFNIFDGLQRHYRVQQAKLEIGKSQQTMNLLEHSVDLETRSALVQFNNSISSLRSQSRNRDLAKHVQEVAQRKYEEGVGSNLEVVTAESALRESEANYFNAVYNMLVAKLDYQKAIGALVK
jgi:outer membrane protein